MYRFRIIRHDDYHGDAMVFSVVDEDGCEHGRFVSEADALEPHLEAMAKAEARRAAAEVLDAAE
jgi:hypothetical protein